MRVCTSCQIEFTPPRRSIRPTLSGFIQKDSSETYEPIFDDRFDSQGRIINLCVDCRQERLESNDRLWEELKTIRQRRTDQRFVNAYENQVAESLMSFNIPFEREYSIGRYRVDFFLQSFATVLEVDGFEKSNEYETTRQRFIEESGFKVVRIRMPCFDFVNEMEMIVNSLNRPTIPPTLRTSSLSTLYIRWRDCIRRRDQNKCVVCGVSNVRLVIQYLVPYEELEKQEWTIETSNQGRLVCRRCVPARGPRTVT